MKNFKELVEYAKHRAPKRCVVVNAQDETVLEAVRQAQGINLIQPVLVGNREGIERCAKKANLHLDDQEVVDAEDEGAAMRKALASIKEQGDILMKGMISTANFLKGVLDKDHGLRSGRILSHIAVLEIPNYHKLIFMSDGGMNTCLDLKIRLDIIKNGIEALDRLGVKQPKIGLIAASETINPDMPETIDAVKIVEMAHNGELGDCVVEGPFGLDVAISLKAAEHKKMRSRIAGDVDFLLMPNISAANIWAKGLIYFAQAKAAGMVVGAARPVVMLSRADDAETKLNSIALGVAIS